ncbi:DUF2613 family protein [Jatrophihabitans telluris]|uniref:DUF2613 family protein n=1 Tax=Jatrophihabitans telluris TaxID=2038343 RepID=A0ABY4QVK8_9ACTN|nr:DUF2613 family protein [Jatrophihabitans telluris]UQX87132.1 DUF2613 family protein [Jatrophihabitans telluris]
MAKLISLILSGIVGAALAGVAVAGVVSSATAAPKHNPANTQIVDYGNR